MLINSHPNLRCLDLSETPVTQPIFYRLDKRRYKHSITKASPGRRPREEGGTGRDIWYSIVLNGRWFLRLKEELCSDYGYRYAYMFNVPFVTRHVASGKRPSTVIRMSTNKAIAKTSKALGKDIYSTYAGYEVGDIMHNQRKKSVRRILGVHLQEGYGVV